MDSCVPDTQREGYLTSKSANRRLRRPFVFLLPFLPGASQGAYNINFHEQVTPIARETLHIHNEFMLIITGKASAMNPQNSAALAGKCSGSGR